MADSLHVSPISSIFSSANLADAQSNGIAAINAGNQRLTQDAQQIANPDSQNVAPALVDLNQSRVLTEAGANVISTENKMLGTLLDLFA
jgi:NAD-dependent SIR2 family protein deacetylase